MQSLCDVVLHEIENRAKNYGLTKLVVSAQTFRLRILGETLDGHTIALNRDSELGELCRAVLRAQGDACGEFSLALGSGARQTVWTPAMI